jgi:hypothetical protein
MLTEAIFSKIEMMEGRAIEGIFRETLLGVMLKALQTAGTTSS